MFLLVLYPPPLFWGWILLILQSPKGDCCSISDDLSSSSLKSFTPRYKWFKDRYTCKWFVPRFKWFIPILLFDNLYLGTNDSYLGTNHLYLSSNTVGNIHYIIVDGGELNLGINDLNISSNHLWMCSVCTSFVPRYKWFIFIFKWFIPIFKSFVPRYKWFGDRYKSLYLGSNMCT